MASSKVRSRKRFKTYLGWLLATVGVILAACFAVNCLVDPLWYLRGNVLSHINYPFNERLAAIVRFLPRLADYDCVIFGTSRASLLPDEKIEGYRCYNLSISDGNAPEYVLYAKYLRERGFRPRLIIVDVKRGEFIGPTQPVEVSTSIHFTTVCFSGSRTMTAPTPARPSTAPIVPTIHPARLNRRCSTLSEAWKLSTSLNCSSRSS